MDIKELTQSKKVATIIGVLVVVAIMLGAFSLGERIGFHKALFAFQNGNNFYRAFGPGARGGGPQEFSNAHGVVGKVVSVTLPTITVEDRDNTEKVILATDTTAVREFRDTLALSDIKVGDYVVVIGEPNASSQIAATLIRILPPPPEQ